MRDIVTLRYKKPNWRLKVSSKVKLWDQTILFLMLTIIIITSIISNPNYSLEIPKNKRVQPKDDISSRDPMEACYLANNRASESLTISESTPVGSIVGELMVNGNSSQIDGNIELSISMPNNNNNIQHDLINRAIYAQRRRSDQLVALNVNSTNNNDLISTSNETKLDLNSLIHLMPPLTIERETKRLILAKKLDREALDLHASNGQASSLSSSSGTTSLAQPQSSPSASSSSSSSSSSLSSSASLTVHVKCQLRGAQDSSKNSILIPIHLIVTDDNDNWPTFINAPYIIDLNESAPIGTILHGNDIVAVDSDQQGPFSTIEYSIVNGNLHSDSFAFLNPLDARSLVVKDNQHLDYESQSRLSLKIMAKDQGDPANWAISTLYINLLDLDDLNPIFGDDKYTGLLRDNKPGEQIDLLPRRLVARDGDRSLDSPIGYSFHIKTNQSIHFDLDRDLGKLTLKKSLPEDQAPFCLLVRATQLDNPQRYSMAAVNLQLISGAAHASQSTHFIGPKFMHSNFTIEISESVQPGFTVLNLQSILVSGSVENLNFHLLDDETQTFKLDQKLARLTLNKSLDYEMYRHLSIRIIATYEYPSQDSLHHNNNINRKKNNNLNSTLHNQLYYPSLVCDTIRVNIQVINHNEFKPEFSHEIYNFQLSIGDLIASFDNKTNGELSVHKMNEDSLNFKALIIGQIYCSDRDSSDRISIQLNGNKANLFHLTQDGHLYLPLVNTSLVGPSNQLNQQLSPQTKRGAFDKDFASSNSWFSPSWVFGSSLSHQTTFQTSQQSHRRYDINMANDLGPQMDRNYLNFLLSELSNLSFLKLKVHATDDGRPQNLKSSSIIVINLISVDNFIIRQSQSNNHGENFNGNVTEKLNSERVMMFQATNGRSFIPVHNDIINSLILVSNQTNDNDHMRGADSILRPRFESPPNSSNEIQQQTEFQTLTSKSLPSLLVVEGDEARFLTMPSAIERAVSQHVNSQRDTPSIGDRSKLKHNPKLDDNGSQSSWYPYSSKNNINLDWINFHPTQSILDFMLAILMNLTILALLLLLFTKYRSIRQQQRSSLSHSSLFDPPDGDISWISRVSSLFDCVGSKSTRVPQNAITSIQSRTAAIYKGIGPNNRNGSDSSDFGSGYAFLSSNDKLQTNPVVGLNGLKQTSNRVKRQYSSSDISSSCDSEKSTTSSNGKIVNGLKLSPRLLHSVELANELEKSSDRFGQLRLTMNKVLESDKLRTNNKQADSLSNLKRIQDSPQQLSGKLPKSSTFLGLHSPTIQATTSNNVDTSNTIENKSSVLVSVVNISPKISIRDNLNSSSTSISSGSLSNISLRINKAVEEGSDDQEDDSSGMKEEKSSNCKTELEQGDSANNINCHQSSLKRSASRSSPNVGVGDNKSSEKGKGSSPSNRRPLPQNPIHLKLKQQASSLGHSLQTSMGCNQGSSLKPRVQHVLNSRPVPPPTPPLSSTQNISTVSNSKDSVSPTTSVDRGYESFQSLSSHVQTQHKVPTSSTKMINNIPHPPPPPPPPPPQMDLVNVEGRVRQTKRQLESKQESVSHRQSAQQQQRRASTSCGRYSTVAVGRARRRDLRAHNSMKMNQDSVVIGGTRFRSKTLQNSNGRYASDTCDADETEDDDFHYGPIKTNLSANDNLLAEYASHQYINNVCEQPIEQLERELMFITQVAAEEQQRQQLSAMQLMNSGEKLDSSSKEERYGISSIKSKALRGSRNQTNQYMLHNNHHNHHHHHHSHKKQTRSMSICEQERASLAQNKKHLTWSDQVGIV